MLRLLIGAAVAGAAAWYWRNEIMDFIDSQVPGAREKAAETYDAVEQSADEFFERAKSRVGVAKKAAKDFAA